MSAFEADRFNHSRTSPKISCQWPVVRGQYEPLVNDASEKIPAPSLPNVRPVRHPGFPSDDSDWGDSPPAESNGWRLPSGRRHHTPDGGGGHEPPLPHTWRTAQLWQTVRSRRAGGYRGFVP